MGKRYKRVWPIAIITDIFPSLDDPPLLCHAAPKGLVSFLQSAIIYYSSAACFRTCDSFQLY